MINIPDLKEIIKKYGTDAQMDMAMEECAELIQVINKVKRNKYGSVDKLTEEIADVLIMIEQLKLMEDISDYMIQMWVDAKYDRQIKRMEEEGE